MKEDQDLSTRVYGRSPLRDKLECGCEEHAQARIDMLVLVQTTQVRTWNKREHGNIKLPDQWKNSWERTGFEDAGTEEEKSIRSTDDTRDC